MSRAELLSPFNFHRTKRVHALNSMTAQLCIAFTGVIAIWLSQDTNPKRRRWACVFGLCGQPFWFYSSFTAAQWGIFAMCFLYTWSWLRGLRNNWLQPKPVRCPRPKPVWEPERGICPRDGEPCESAGGGVMCCDDSHLT